MGARSEKRAEKKAQAALRFEASKAAIVARVKDLSSPVKQVNVDAGGAPRVAPHLARQAAQAATLPKTLFEGSRFAVPMTYCVTRKDHEGTWSWMEPRAWTAAEWQQEIEPSMTNFSRLTWGEIDALASGSGHKMHHSHETKQLVQEAKQRWVSLGLEEFDTVFRFRMSGTKRAWGYVVQGHFHLVWWDRNHSIFPV